jgi:hypothetical protein
MTPQSYTSELVVYRHPKRQVCVGIADIMDVIIILPIL